MTAGPRRASRGLWGETWRRYMRNPVRVAGAGASLLILVSSLLAPLLAPMRYDLANIAEALQRTDEAGVVDRVLGATGARTVAYES